MKKLLAFSLMFIFAIVFVGCSPKEEPVDENIPVTSVSLSVETTDLKVGDTVSVNATVLPKNATNKSISYKSSKPTVATVGNDGMVTAISAGTTVITATADGKIATITINVSDKEVELAVDGIPTSAIEVGQTITLVPNKEATFVSSDDQIVTVNENGEVEAISAGIAFITVKANEEEVKVLITVIEIVNNDLVITSTETQVMVDFSITLTANKTVVWSTSNEEIATVDATGKVIGIKEGTVTITAAAGEETAELAITVIARPNPTKLVIIGNNTVNLNSSVLLRIDATQVEPAGAYTTVTWSTSNEAIATIDEDGTVHGIALGNVTITATSTKDTSVIAEIVVDVKEKDEIPVEEVDPTEIIVNGEEAIYNGRSTQLSAIVYPEGADQSVEWRSTKSSVATIDATGKVTAVGIGTAYIIASSKNFPEIQAQRHKIVVTEAPAPDPIPDLGGYEIVILNAAGAEKDNDPFLEGYKGADKTYKQQAWLWVEDQYNVDIQVKAYPTEAPWGPQRIAWINTNAELGNAQADFYIVTTDWISQFVNASAAYNIADLYSRYGEGQMENAVKQSATYKGGLYAMSTGLSARNYVDKGIFYNVALMESLGLESPAKMFNEGRWTYSAFVQYSKAAQALLPEGSYALSGQPILLWMGMVNAAGIRVADTTALRINVDLPAAKVAASSLREIVESNAFDTSGIAWDANVVSFKEGKALMQVGDLWFVRGDNRWTEDMWGEDTRFGYVPFPYPDTLNKDQTRLAHVGGSIYMMASQRKYPSGVDAIGVYRALNDMFLKTLEYQANDINYNPQDIRRNEASSKIDDPNSIDAILYFTADKVVFDPLYGIVPISGGTSLTPVIRNIVINGDDYTQAMDSGKATLESEFIRIYG